MQGIQAPGISTATALKRPRRRLRDEENLFANDSYNRRRIVARNFRVLSVHDARIIGRASQF
jgi:hypothetical protein